MEQASPASDPNKVTARETAGRGWQKLANTKEHRPPALRQKDPV